MGAKELQRWPRTREKLDDRPRRLTREELAEKIASAKRLNMTHVQIQIPRSLRPSARMRLDGRSSPWSDHRRKISKVQAGLWAAWWNVEEVAAWLAK